ncbi:MAG TPA: DnaJ domain-containing protein [Elusimicrobiota bacterium]|nr:DnaJ domain-containing protein [Elusimicrobiota bacterium]
MLNPTICPKCLQPNEPARTLCWKCLRSLAEAPTESDYTRLFGLSRSWNSTELKAAYHQLARRYHPDVNPGNREADAFFKYVNKGYEALAKQGGPTPAPPPPPKQDEGIAELNDKLRAVVHSYLEERKNTPVKPTRFQTLTKSLRRLWPFGP